MKDNFNDGKNNSEKYNKNKSNKKNDKTEVNCEIWLKQQPLIIHVACRNLEAGKKLLEISRRLFKKAGIIGMTEKKVTVEVIGSEHLETIVADNNFIADEKYLRQLVKYANRNFMENRKKIRIFLYSINRL